MRIRNPRRTLLLALGVLLVLILAGGGAYYYTITHRPLPQHAGDLTLTGLRDEVEILRDTWGVPHIYASNPHDLFFAQGYSHAQDRWWQMDVARLLAQGRLGELVGAATLNEDLQLRAWGLRRASEREWAQTDADTRAYLQAFADGVNAYLAERAPGELAVQYTALGLAGMEATVTPWSPVDTLAYGRFISFGLSANYGVEEVYSRLLDAVGPEMAADFLPPFPFGEKPTILYESDIPAVETARTAPAGAQSPSPPALAATIPPAPVPQSAGIGSNNWVVSGDMTETGMPLLANDPHLGIGMPSIWYEIGLHCQPVSDACPFDVTGFTFVPFPGVALGHNQAIAWGATVAGPDVQDLYQIRVNPDDPFQYEWNGEWRDMEVYEETFAFADDAAPRTFRFRVTHLGPIINDYRPDEETGEPGGLNDEEPLALRWTALDGEPFFQAIFGLDKATNWEEFRAALADWNFGSMNFVYADVAGNIGYQMPGRVPIRAANHPGTAPVPGWTDAYQWQGFIPYDLLPRLYNPERGFIVTANQTVVPPAYWEYLAQELGPDAHYDFQPVWTIFGYRAERITELLLAEDTHSIASFRAIQMDNALLPAGEMMPYLADLDLDDPDLADARDWLLRWDTQMDAASPQAALYGFFWKNLLEVLYNDQLPEEMPPANALHMWPTSRLLSRPGNAWWDDATTPDVVETRDDILRRALAAGYDETTATLGDDRDAWRWSDVHTATFASLPLGQSGIAPLEAILNRGPVPVSGGSNVVNATSWQEGEEDYFGVSVLPSMRMVVDMSDLSQSVTMHTTGQSGHPAGDHYDDMITPWQNGDTHPMLWTRSQVEAAATHVLHLHPASP